MESFQGSSGSELSDSDLEEVPSLEEYRALMIECHDNVNADARRNTFPIPVQNCSVVTPINVQLVSPPAPSTLSSNPQIVPLPPPSKKWPPPFQTGVNSNQDCGSKNPLVLKSMKQYTFLQNPLGVALAIVPAGWNWRDNEEELQGLIDQILHDLHAAVGEVCVMFGASQLKSWMERSCHAGVYQSNRDVVDDENFPFTLKRCLTIW